jgi:hypothetical protein
MRYLLRVSASLAFVALMVALMATRAPAVTLASPECRWQPGDTCMFHCTVHCDAGCCGDMQIWAWDEQPW